MEITGAGESLRGIRQRLSLTTRHVDRVSRKLAEAKGIPDYVISHARLIQIEHGESTPSVYKLSSLSAIYGVTLGRLLALYVNLPRAHYYHLESAPANTRLISRDADEAGETVELPVRFAPGADVRRTNLVTRIVDSWGEVPIALLRQLSLRQSRWGYIGLNDYTMRPLLRPGWLVQIDEDWEPASRRRAQSELERPIYFVELRDGYVCSWCEFQGNRLLCVPHPLSPVPIRQFAYPQQAKIVGRVTAMVARLVELEPPHPERTPGSWPRP